MTFTMQQLMDWLPAVRTIAQDAGREIMTIYRAGFSITLKDDRSPLTEADLAAQRVIGAGLAALTPHIPMIGEESPAADLTLRRSWPTLWLVDPLDGTREFVKRNGEFTVNIALVHAHEPVLGLLYAPARGVTYYAARGAGVFRVDDGGAPVPVHARATAPAVLRVLGSRSHSDRKLAAALEMMGPHELIGVGSALKFGLLAEGQGDFYARMSQTSEWDTAAGQAILEEAGGHVVGLDGQPLRYNAGPRLANPAFLAYADASRDWLTPLRTAYGRER
jgi:3'(2'), 5'-bisphosphate nucleotidase